MSRDKDRVGDWQPWQWKPFSELESLQGVDVHILLPQPDEPEIPRRTRLPYYNIIEKITYGT